MVQVFSSMLRPGFLPTGRMRAVPTLDWSRRAELSCRGRTIEMESRAINAELLRGLARHQAWADIAHWKTLHENSTLLEDLEIRMRLNHMVMALRMLTALAQGEKPDPSGIKDIEPANQLEAALEKANADLIEAINTTDFQKMIALPRGP